MPFHLVTGRAHAGKTGVIAEHIARATELGRPSVMLLPTQADVVRAREEFAFKNPIGLTVTTFDRWLENMWSLYGDGRRLVSVLTRETLVARACDVAGPYEIATASSGTRGFQKMVGRVAARLCDKPAGASGAAERDVGRVVDAYYQILDKHGLVEPSQAAAQLAKKSPVWDGLVVVNRFVDLSEAQERLLVALGKNSEVVVGLVWERDFPPTQALDDLVMRLTAVASDCRHCCGGAPDDELGRLETDLYAGRTAASPARAGEPRKLEVGIAAGSDAEVELIAQRVHAFVSDGVMPDRIAIVFRNPAPHAARLLSALERRGIPASRDMAIELGQTPLGRAFLALLSVCLGHGSREAFYAFLASPFSAAPQAAVVAADRRWRKLRLDAAGALLSRSDDFGEQASRIIAQARSLARAGVCEDNGRKWKYLADLLLQAAEGRSANAEERLLDAASHRTIVSSVQSVVEMHGSSLETSEFVAVLQDAKVVISGGDRAGRVQITDVARLRSRRFDVVVIGGLTSDEFSSEYREPLAARYVRELGGRGGTDERLSERMLFYLLITRARDRVVLVRRGTNEKGEPVRASVFWEEVVDLYRLPDDEDDQALPDGIPVTYFGMSRLSSIVAASSPSRHEQRDQAHGSRLRAKRSLHAALGEAAMAQLAASEEFSTTDLEEYLQCPYKWFYGRTVRPHEIDSQIDAREMGTLAHNLMRAFYERFHSAGHERVTPDSLSEALETFSAVAPEVLESRRLLEGLSFADELAVRRAYRWAEDTVRADATFMPGYRPVSHEQRFGLEGTPPITVDGVRLRGSIDRVEVGPAGVVVIDYKTGSGQVTSWTKFESEGHLQPAIYALAAAQLFDLPPVAGVYRRMGTNAVKGFWRDDKGVPFEAGPRVKDRLDETGVSAVLESARQRLHVAVEGIRRGAVAPAPLSPGACTYCAVRAFCPEVAQ